MKRLASLLLLCLFSISVFAACDKGSVSNTDNAASEQPSKINYAEEGFSIIRPDGSDGLIELSSGIFKAVRDATSQKLTNTTDATEPNSAGEILIGNTNRPQSKRAIELIREKGAFPSYNDFINGYVKGVRDYDRNNTFANEFHTYGVEWTEQDVTFYRDGTPTVHYNYVGTPAEFLYRQEAYIMFSMLTGSNLTGLTEAESDAGVGIRRPVLGAYYWQDGRQNFVVEYVQLYQKEGQYRNDKTPK